MQSLIVVCGILDVSSVNFGRVGTPPPPMKNCKFTIQMDSLFIEVSPSIQDSCTFIILKGVSHIQL